MKETVFSITHIVWNKRSVQEKAKHECANLNDVLDTLPENCRLRLQDVIGLDHLGGTEISHMIRDALMDAYGVYANDFKWSK